MPVDTTTLIATTDTPAHRTTVAEFDDATLDEWLSGIRKRRMLAYKRYAEVEEVKRQTQQEQLRDALEKQCNMLAKEQVRLDTALEKFETRLVRIRAIRMSIEDGFTGRWRDNSVDTEPTEDT